MNGSKGRQSPLDSEARVLVTGGSGFMGTHLIQDLADDGISVLNIDVRRPVLSGHVPFWTELDILDYEHVLEVFGKYRPTHVVHLAARTDLEEKKDIEGYASNIRGVENILESVAHTASVKRLIITSSMLVCRIGYRPESDDDYATSTLYGDSKVLTEKITRRMDPQCTWTLIRPTTIWGPYHLGMENAFFRMLKKGLYIHPGNKPCMRSYGYVGNSIYQIRAILNAEPELVHRKTLYISDPEINLREWVGAFSMKLLGKDVKVAPFWLMRLLALSGDLLVKMGIKQFPLTTFRLTNMTTNNVADIEPIMSISGPLPYSLEDGIDATVHWLNKAQ